MSVRRRTWQNQDGTQGEAWVVNYTDQAGIRRLRSFGRRKEADAFAGAVSVDVRRGIHVPDSQSITVAEAARLWLGTAAELEPTTLLQYRTHVDLHIVPLIGSMKLSRLTVPAVRVFEDKLRADRSPAMVRKVRTSLGSILADAQERGLVAQNVVHSLRSKRRRGKERGAERRRIGTLKVGVDIPTPDEIRAIVAQLDKDHRYRPLLLTAIFTGLRGFGTAWSALEGCQTQRRLYRSSPTSRSLPQNRANQVLCRRAHHSVGADANQCLADLETRLPEG